MMSNFWKTMRFSIVVFSFFYGCVGPPEPDHGLIENKSVVVNDVSVFSFLMRNDRHTFEEEYNFNFSNINPNNTLTSSLIISEYAGMLVIAMATRSPDSKPKSFRSAPASRAERSACSE